MFITKFIIALLAITAAGPLANEGGAQCIENEATTVKECVENAIDNRQPLDYSKLNG